MRIIYLKKQKLLISALILSILLIIVFFNINTIKNYIQAAAPKRELPIYRVARDDNKASISFDAAWGNEDTEQIIQILGKYKVKATFFVVGSWVTKYPESVKALSDAGHEIMNHSDSHPHMTRLSKEAMIKETLDCGQKIESITKVKPFLLRPPYGDYNDTLIKSLNEIGYYTIQWDVDSLDWMDKSASEIKTRVVNRIKPGSIVLFHNAAKNTPEALPGILEEIQKKNIQLVKISELILKDNYKIDSSGEQYSLNKTHSQPEQ